jgi:hypothetical protein
MNTTLSDKHDDVLAAQGVGFIKRKAIGMVTVSVTNTVKQVDGVTVIESASHAANVPGAKEEVWLDNKPHGTNHEIYGQMITTATTKKPEEITDAWLKADWLPESADADGKLLFIHSESDPANKNKWHADVVSGYANIEVDGVTQKRWVRKNAFKCTSKPLERNVRLVYDYVS